MPSNKSKELAYCSRRFFVLGLDKLLVQNLEHINVFLELWAQLFKKIQNLGNHQLAIKLEETQGAHKNADFRPVSEVFMTNQ